MGNWDFMYSTGTIINDDQKAMITGTSAVVHEGKPGDNKELVFRLTRTGSMKRRLQVKIMPSNGVYLENQATMPSDFDGTTQVIVFEPFQAEAFYKSKVVGDLVKEKDEEMFIYILSNDNDYTYMDTNFIVLGTILNDD
jgi:hypothetical protein